MAQVAEVPVLTRRADLDLMSSFLGLLLDGEGDEEGNRWAEELAELKARGLVRQTRSARPVPTGKGRALWSHVRAVRARAVLQERPGAGRPLFVVFNQDGVGEVFKDWNMAAARAKKLLEAGVIRPNGPLLCHEDLIESWPASHLSPGLVERVDELGHDVLEG